MNKSFISTFIAALLALSNAKSETPERILRRGNGDKLAKLQNLIDTECTPSFSCPVTPSKDDCTFEKLERPDITGLNEDQIEKLMEEFQALKQERKQQLLTCACCGKFTLEEMRPQGADGSGSRPQGSEGQSGSARPDMFGGGGGGGSRPEGAEGSVFQGGGSQSGSGRPGRGGGLRQPVEAEVEVSGGDESTSLDEGDTSLDDGSTSADESPQVGEGQSGIPAGRGGTLRPARLRQPFEAEVDVSGGDESTSLDEGDTSADGSTSADVVGEGQSSIPAGRGGGLRQLSSSDRSSSADESPHPQEGADQSGVPFIGSRFRQSVLAEIEVSGGEENTSLDEDTSADGSTSTDP